MNKIILLTVMFVLATACTKKPNACFILNENKGSAKINEEVKFDATCSENTESHAWNYGNSNTDVGVSVKTKYTMPGLYTVTLTAKNGSKSDTETQTINVTN